MLALTNRLRKAHRAAALSWSASLEARAQAHVDRCLPVPSSELADGGDRLCSTASGGGSLKGTALEGAACAPSPPYKCSRLSRDARRCL